MFVKGEVKNAILNTKKQDWFPSFLSMQQIYRCQLTFVAWYACPKAITAFWHLYVYCIFKKIGKAVLTFVFIMIFPTSLFR